MSFSELLPLLGVALLETCYMAFFSLFLAALIGIPYGMILFVTQKKWYESTPAFQPCY